MYETQIKRVGELVYGPERFTVGLAIHKVAREAGIPVSSLAQALRQRKTVKDHSAQSRERWRTTVPNRMMTNFVER